MDAPADLSHLPRELAVMVERELEPGEKITWAGQPVPGRFARRMVPVALFGVACLVFLVFIFTGGNGGKFVRHATRGNFLVLVLVAAIALGILGTMLASILAIMATPLWRWLEAKRTAYVLTDRRALIVRAGLRGGRARSFQPGALGGLRIEEEHGGRGDLVLDRGWSGKGDWAMQVMDYGFIGINDVKQVHALAKALKDRGAAGTAADPGVVVPGAPDLSRLPPGLVARAERALKHGETIRWMEQPEQWPFARRELSRVLSGFIPAAFAVLWFWGAAHAELPATAAHWERWVLPLLGVPFALIALNFFLKPVMKARRAAHTGYVVTDHRALVLEVGNWGRKFTRSYTAEELGAVRRVDRRDGSGDVVLEREWVRLTRGGFVLVDRGFLAVHDARAAERRVRGISN